MVNDVLNTYACPETPLGGVKQSGFGRTHSTMGLRDMCETAPRQPRPRRARPRGLVVPVQGRHVPGAAAAARGCCSASGRGSAMDRSSGALVRRKRRCDAPSSSELCLSLPPLSRREPPHHPSTTVDRRAQRRAHRARGVSAARRRAKRLRRCRRHLRSQAQVVEAQRLEEPRLDRRQGGRVRAGRDRAALQGRSRATRRVFRRARARADDRHARRRAAAARDVVARMAACAHRREGARGPREAAAARLPAHAGWCLKTDAQRDRGRRVPVAAEDRRVGAAAVGQAARCRARRPGLGRDVARRRTRDEERPRGLCLVTFDAAKQAALRAEMDKVGTCLAGGFEDVLLHPRAVLPNNTYAQVSTQNGRVCALSTAGEITCCGPTEPALPPPPKGPFTQIAAGGKFGCALDAKGTATCWGAIAAPPAGPFTKISAEYSHACGVRPSGELACWGAGNYNVAQAPAGSFRDVAAAQFSTCGVHRDGTIACWGEPSRGTHPAGSFARIAADWTHACGIRTDGTLGCWRDEQVDTPLAGTFTDVAVGDLYAACALGKDGSIACVAPAGKPDAVITPPPTGTFTQLAGDHSTYCAVGTDHHIACWGEPWPGSWSGDNTWPYAKVLGLTPPPAPPPTAKPGMIAMAGRIVDERGQPVANAEVLACAVERLHGRREVGQLEGRLVCAAHGGFQVADRRIRNRQHRQRRSVDGSGQAAGKRRLGRSVRVSRRCAGTRGAAARGCERERPSLRDHAAPGVVARRRCTLRQRRVSRAGAARARQVRLGAGHARRAAGAGLPSGRSDQRFRPARRATRRGDDQRLFRRWCTARARNADTDRHRRDDQGHRRARRPSGSRPAHQPRSANVLRACPIMREAIADDGRRLRARRRRRRAMRHRRGRPERARLDEARQGAADAVRVRANTQPEPRD